MVEVSDASILVRYGLRWMEFTHAEYRTSDGVIQPFALTENGCTRIGANEDVMDLFAERLASAIIAV